MIKKRLLLLAVCGMLGLSAAACGAASKKTTDGSKTEKAANADTESEQATADSADDKSEDQGDSSDDTAADPKDADTEKEGADTSDTDAEEADDEKDTPEYIQKHGQVLKQKKRDASEESNDSQGWGIGPDRDDFNRPVDCTTYQNDYVDYYADFIVPVVNPDVDKFLYLTFDEGYENGFTESILDTLKEKNAKAVFFVTGPYIKEAPDLVQRMIDEGHIVGNHTQNHPSGGITTLESAKAMKKELKQVHKTMKKKYDYDMYLFRPPEGVFSDRSLAVAENLGYRTVLWSFAHRDYEPESQPDPGEALELCKEKLSPGAIYLLHGLSETNAAILGDFIDYAKDEGYEIGDYQAYVEGMKAEDEAAAEAEESSESKDSDSSKSEDDSKDSDSPEGEDSSTDDEGASEAESKAE